MKTKWFKNLFFGIILISFSSMLISCTNRNVSEINTIPGLPQPIAREGVLITSAGQSTDTYIVKDIANQLMIHNYFMPQAKPEDLQDIRTIVFVVGYSPIGEKLHSFSYDDEKKRIEALVNKSKDQGMTVITVIIGGKQRRNSRTDELLKIICTRTDYLIGVREANSDDFLSELAGKNNIPMTLVKSVNDISEPFASAFR
jgi:hypothetical protein